MSTALDLINSSFRLIGALASGESSEASEANDALITLNQMLSSWSLDRLMVYSVLKETFTWASGNAYRTIGLTGNFVTTRPTKIETATFTSGGLDFTLDIIGSKEYQEISNKSLTTSHPEKLYYDASNPNGTIYLYGVPSADISLNLSTWRQITSVSALSTTLAYPPGYERAIRFNLAIELANEWGLSVKSETANIANDSLALLKDLNRPDMVMNLDPSFPSQTDSRTFNINRGW